MRSPNRVLLDTQMGMMPMVIRQPSLSQEERILSLFWSLSWQKSLRVAVHAPNGGLSRSPVIMV